MLLAGEGERPRRLSRRRGAAPAAIAPRPGASRRVQAFVDAWLHERQLPLERPALHAAAELVGSVEGQRVLDLASGTGALAEEVLASGGTPSSLVALDREPAMLVRATRRLAPQLPGTGVRVVCADARTIRLSEQFDVVMGAYLLHLLEPADAARVLGTIAAHLAPGGRGLLALHAPECGPAPRVYRALWNALAGAFPAVIPAIRLSSAQLGLRDAGLEAVREECRAGAYPTRLLLVRARATHHSQPAPDEGR